EGHWYGNMAIQRRDGSLVPVEVRVTAVVLAEETMYLTVLRPLVTRRALERVQERFIAMMSQELKGMPVLHRAFVQLIQRHGSIERLLESAASPPGSAGPLSSPMLARPSEPDAPDRPRTERL